MEKFSFLGSFNRKLDAKGRLTIPSTYNHQFGNDKRLILSRVERVNYPIIAVFPSLLIYNHNINSYFGFDKVTGEVEDYWSSLSDISEIDGAGRIGLRNIPTFSKITEVTVFGRGTWFEVWRTDDFSEYSEKLKSLRK